MIFKCRGATFSLLFLMNCSIWSADWPQWRGPQRNGHVPKNEIVPTTLPAEPRIVWRTRIGDGLASPVVAAGKVFYADTQQNQETLHAADAATGKILWSTPIDAAFKDMQSVAGPRCTPMVDGDRVYAQ